MEEIEDLEVALWLQNDETKEIYNSHFAYGYTDHCYPVRDLTAAASNEATAIRWSAPETGSPNGYNVYINSKLVAENISELEFVTNGSNLGKIAEVVALYENGMTSVSVAKVIVEEDNINSINEEKLNIYPNPANDVLKIETEYEINEIAIYDIYGRRQVTVTPNRQIDVADLTSGVYFIKINTEKGNIVKRFIKQ